MADTHGAQEPHEPQEDTSDHGHDTVSDAPIARPDGTMPPSGQRPLSLGIGIAGTLILLLVVAGVILYMNRNGNTAEAPGGANTAGGAAPEAILTNASLKELSVGASLSGGNVPLGQFQPGTFKQQSGVLKQRPAESRAARGHALAAASTTATRTPTPGAGGKATATPTKAAQGITYQDPDGRFVVRLPAGWTADDSQKTDWFLVEFDGADPQGGPYMYINSEDAQDGTLDDFIALDQQSHAQNTKFTFKDGVATDTTVVGEPAKTFTYTYVSKAKPNATPWTGQQWEFIHNGARWRFSVDAIGSHKSEVSAILSTFTFTDSTNNGNGESTTWTDQNGLITLTYPSAWTAGTADGDDSNVLLVKSADGASFGLDIFDQQGTPADELKSIKDNRSANTGFKFTFGTVVDLKIGGEPAKMLPWTWVSKQNASSKGAGRDYVVNHNGKWFGVTTLAADTNSFGDLEAIITSMAFGSGGNNNNGQTTTWKDPNGLLQLQYANGWKATVDSSDKYNLVTLDSPDGVAEIFIEVFDPQSGTLDQEIQSDKDYHAKSTKYTYKDGAVTDLKIGGDPAKGLSYTYVPKDKPNNTPNPGQIWEVNHGGKEFYIQASPYVQDYKTAMDAIVASITFGK